MTTFTGNEFTFIWRIENFSFCTETKGVKLESPQFTVETLKETQWCLVLYPKGDIDDTYIACYLERAAIDPGPKKIIINYELSLISADGPRKFLEEKRYFSQSKKYGTSKLLARNEIFRQKDTPLPLDVLIIQCKMWKDKLEDVGQCWARTRIGVEKRYFTWTIKNFSELESGQKQTYRLSAASNPNLFFDMALYLTDTALSDGRVEIEIAQLAINHPIYLTCKISVLDHNGFPSLFTSDEHLFRYNQEIPIWHFPPFLTVHKLKEGLNTYLQNGSLSLRFELAISTGEESRQIDVISYGKTSEYEVNAVQDIASTSSTNLAADLYALYHKKDLCDFSIQVGGEAFPVHKAILGARSAVLNAMLQHNMRENQTNRMVIDDLDVETVACLLQYLYSDVLREMHWESASKLYLAADKYQILSLKQQCLLCLKANFSMSNACLFLGLADQHKDKDLKTAVHDFISPRYEEFFNSVEWKELEKNFPPLACETMSEIILKRNKT